MWYNMTVKNIQILNKFQHFIVKRILDLKTSTRSDMCQSIVGLHPIVSYIDKRKLFFLQKLCTLDDKYLTKKIFLVRLFSYCFGNEHKCNGYFSDIINILFKYELHTYLVDFIMEGVFPTKETWKTIVHNVVDNVQSNDWKIRISSDNDFKRFRNIQHEVRIAKFWKLSKSITDIKNSYFITKLLTEVPSNTQDVCAVCHRVYIDVYVHACCNCFGTWQIQDAWWDTVIDNFPVELFNELYSKDEEELYQILLGSEFECREMVDYDNFLSLCHTHVIQCLAHYNRIIRYGDFYD